MLFLVVLATKIEDRSLDDHVDLIRLLANSLDDENVFDVLNKFSNEFRRSYVLVHGFISFAASKVCGDCTFSK